jgi:hypothetical protein
MRAFASALLLLLPSAAFSTSAVLIPTLYVGTGAFASRWRTVVVLNNLTDSPFSSPGVKFTILCSPDQPCDSDSVPVGQFGSVEAPRPANGLLLYLPTEDAPIIFAARVAAAPRIADTEGTELPIVHETSFSRNSLQFPYVPYLPLRNPFRTSLRVYALGAPPGSAVRIEVRSWRNPNGPASATTTIPLDIPSSEQSLPIFPAFGQLNVQEEFRGLSDTLCNIKLIPMSLTSGDIPRIWAFITVTDNITQEVTIQTPQ